VTEQKREKKQKKHMVRVDNSIHAIMSDMTVLHEDVMRTQSVDEARASSLAKRVDDLCKSTQLTESERAMARITSAMLKGATQDDNARMTALQDVDENLKVLTERN